MPSRAIGLRCTKPRNGSYQRKSVESSSSLMNRVALLRLNFTRSTGAVVVRNDRTVPDVSSAVCNQYAAYRSIYHLGATRGMRKDYSGLVCLHAITVIKLHVLLSPRCHPSKRYGAPSASSRRSNCQPTVLFSPAEGRTRIVDCFCGWYWRKSQCSPRTITCSTDDTSCNGL